MNFQIQFSRLTLAELGEVIDSFAGSAAEVIVTSPSIGGYDVTTRWTDDVRFGAVQLDHLHERLKRLPEPATPVDIEAAERALRKYETHDRASTAAEGMDTGVAIDVMADLADALRDATGIAGPRGIGPDELTEVEAVAFGTLIEEDPDAAESFSIYRDPDGNAIAVAVGVHHNLTTDREV